MESPPPPSGSSTRRYLRAVRHPDVQKWFGWYDPRSWAVVNRIRTQLDPSLATAREAVGLVRRARRGGRFVATLPRSGSHFLVSMIDAAHAAERGDDPDYDYVTGFRLSGDPAWISRGELLAWPAATGSLVKLLGYDRPVPTVPDVPVLYGHHPMGFGTVSMHDAPGRPVILVRNPKDAMRSTIRKRGLVDLEHSRSEAESTAASYVRWFATWSAALAADETGRILVVRYEALTADPAAQLAAISDHWGLGWSTASIDTAVRVCSRERMEDKTDRDPTNVRVTVGPAPTIDADLLAFVDGILERELVDGFGYDIAPRASAHGA